MLAMNTLLASYTGSAMSFVYGFIVSLVMGLGAFLLRTISMSGMIGGIIFGTIIYGFTGWQGFLIPMTFFIVASTATKHGYLQKLEMGIAQDAGGKRGAKHALANILAGTIFAVLSALLKSGLGALSLVAMVGSFATAVADTSSSEMGQLYGKIPINPLTFKKVRPGTEGAISMEGTLWGIAASIVIVIVAFVTHLIGFTACIAVIIGAFLGNMVESYIGAKSGKEINNEVLNFLNTLIGGLISALLAFLLTLVFNPPASGAMLY